MRIFGPRKDKPLSDKSQEQLSLLRRAVFAYTTTLICFAIVVYVLVSGQTSTLAERVVAAMMSYAELMAMLYLGASVVDRSKIIDRLANRFDATAPTKTDKE